MAKYLYTFIGIMAFLLLCRYWGCSANGNFTGREYMPDMAHSQAYEYYSPSRSVNMADGEVVNISMDGLRSSREPVAGTIPRGFMPYHYPNTPEGYEAAGKGYLNPRNSQHLETFALSEATKNSKMYTDFLAKGKTAYETNCAVCHGNKGASDGPIVASGAFPPPPALTSANLISLPDGKMFHSIHYGRNNMGSYAPQLSKEERWEVISYIKDMQADFIVADYNGKLASDPAGANKTKATKEAVLRTILGLNTYNPSNPVFNTGESIAAVIDVNEPAVQFVPSELDKIVDKPLNKGQSIALNNVFFKSGSAELRSESVLELNKLISFE